MRLQSFLFLLPVALRHALAQSTSTPEAGVPTGTPVVGNYGGPLRPQVHFSPPKGFMNDPNGMFVDADGVYHLYYQYNPTATVAGDQHWGHATTTDGYHWVNQPIALHPPNNITFVYSGSAVVDVNNTSGFFPDQDNGVVAIFTLAVVTDVAGKQTQDIAYSKDGGYTFEYYEGNPVIDVNSTQFRDPKVFWHAPTEKWAMVVSYASDFTIGIYTSPNLKDWEHASNFSHHGLLGIQYECPNLVEIPMEGQTDPMWLMLISINPGAPLGGSISQYFPGTFNGTHFTAVDQVARIADFAKDNYAAQFFAGIPGTSPQISIGWASNWQYTDLVPTGDEGWRSAMTMPREHYLTNLTGLGYDLVALPYNISAVFASELAYNSSLNNGTLLLDYSSVTSGALYFEANITGLSASTLAGTLNMTFSSSLSAESIRLGTVVNGATWLDRSRTYGFDNPFFTDKFSSNGVYSGADANGTWTLSGIIDRSLLELFVNGGEQAGTMVFFPERPLDTLAISAGGLPQGAGASVAVWGLVDAWMAEGSANGTVRGNVTSTA